MTTNLNRAERRRAEAIGRKPDSLQANSYERLKAEITRLNMMQRAYLLHQQKKGSGGNPHQLILLIETVPPMTMRLSYSQIDVRVTTGESSVLELGRHHLCAYTKRIVLGGSEPREAVVLFSLRNRQDELSRAMAALKRQQQRR